MSERAYAAMNGVSRIWAMHPNDQVALAARFESYLAGVDFGPPEQPKVSGGIAIMPMIGALTPRGDAGTVSTMRFEAFFREALRNPGIKGIMLEVDSPGGAVYYTPQVAKRVYDARGSKPVIAYGNGSVGSAAYWIASAAEKFVLAPGAEAGSIGVWVAHQDMSKAMEQQGVNVTIISHGEHKLEGSELGPLSEDARAHLQSRVDELGAEFEGDVARNRGAGVSKVRSEFGQGRMYSAKEAVSRGMADGIATAEKVLKELMGGTPVSYTRKAAAADAALLAEWQASAEALFVAELEQKQEFYAGSEGGFTKWTTDPAQAMYGNPDLLRRRLSLKEKGGAAGGSVGPFRV